MNDFELVIEPPDQEGGMWTCWVGEMPSRGRTRDDAIFWAGWWYGRRQLQTDLGALVENGNRAHVVLEGDRP